MSAYILCVTRHPAAVSLHYNGRTERAAAGIPYLEIPQFENVLRRTLCVTQ